MAAELFRPSKRRIEAAQLTRFARECGFEPDDYAALHRFSVAQRETFWSRVWSFCEVIGELGDAALVDRDAMPGARWFPEARLNFAENLLRRRDDATALVFQGEDVVARSLTYAELANSVAALATGLRARGVAAGDRVAGVLPNGPEAIVAMLASASLGAVWSSCSPDFGPQGILDRFGQIAPKVLFACDGYRYGGRAIDTLARLPELLAALPSIEQTIVVSYDGDAEAEKRAARALPNAQSFAEIVNESPSARPSFEPLSFDHPLYILYSSGTTGQPKCIVHGAGGTLLQHLKEHRLHVDLTADDRLFYFTTCGWMMWNWLVSGLASGARLVLYDGSPTHPDATTLFSLAEREAVTVFGTSAKFLDAAAKAGIAPRETHDLHALRTILSTGSPLLPEGFDYVYEKISPDVQLASISGGTDIVSCFVLGNPTAPVRRGEIQCAGLGMQVEVFDERGRRVIDEEGELVCTKPFPSMPIGFFGDESGERYRSAYFDTWPGVWRHGDWIRETAGGGYVISGRSDAVLNPGGVRIGTAEIYRQVERLDEVVEAIAVGQTFAGDVRVVLFVKLRPGLVLDEALGARIRTEIRENATPRHVPARIAQVDDIPRTRSGKITELAVRDVIHGRAVRNVEALANPEALEHFRDRVELKD